MEIQGQEIKRLIVAGCSFSDYANVNKNYSEFLAEKFEIEHVPGYTSGIGSNERIFRKIMSGIREKKITKSDLLIIQYTEVMRREFWSRFTFPIQRGGNKEKGSYNREPYDNGQIIKYKLDAYLHQERKEERLLFKSLADNFTCSEFEEERFENHHLGLLSVLEKENIRTVFVITGYLSDNISVNLYDSKYCSKIRVNPPLGPFNSVYYPEYCLSENDCTHLSEYGHEKLAEHLYDYILNIRILNKKPGKVIHYDKKR